MCSPGAGSSTTSPMRRSTRRVATLVAALSLILAASATAVTFHGTAGNDFLVGSTGDDVIQGLAGDDIIIGRVGNDGIDGGPGDDTLNGDGTCPLGTSNPTYCSDNEVGGGNDRI